MGKLKYSTEKRKTCKTVAHWLLIHTLLDQNRIWHASNVVNKDLCFKAKAKAKDLTSEHVQGLL